MIVLQHVQKSYGKTQVLDDVSFRIDPGEFVCITGPSGAGKSTLVHLMIGAEAATKGGVYVDGVHIQALPPAILQLYRRRVGVAFQDYKLLWNRTVAENIAFPLEVCGIPDAQISKRVKQVLKEMELTKQADTLTRALSGGEKARTAIARAYVHQPMILFADEPTGNLDPEQSTMVLDLLKFVHEQGATVVLATHEVDIVDALQTRVIRLEDGAVIRDSVGGYDKESKKKTEPVKQQKHKIFGTEAEREEIVRKTSGKSIKITAISS